ncbi:MAG: hypothetical protein Q4C34_07305 [Bacteroidales bacterium]|nr:hypothetical protein [Bacteroidales bacterium]
MLCAWYNTVEFYVIAGAAAAAVVALSALPSRRGAAVLHLEAGRLLCGDEAVPGRPWLEVEVDRNGHVVITRHGLRGVAMDGAVSLAVNVIGFDISIEERLTPGRGDDMAATAQFELDWLGPERYHIKYNSEDAGLFAAFSLPVRPGIRVVREFM